MNNTNTLPTVETMRTEARAMRERGAERFWSSVDLCLDDAAKATNDRALLASLHRAASHMWGMFDGRTAALKSALEVVA